MAWKMCRYCNKRISDKVDVCPWCNKKFKQKKIMANSRNVFGFVCKILYVVFLIVLCVSLHSFCKGLLYSENINDLYIVFGMCIVLFANATLMGLKLFLRSKRNVVNIILSFIMFVVLVFSVVYFIKCINAYRYRNSIEILKLSEKFSVNESKRIKTSIEKVFEYDFDNVSSRNVIIGNFYKDDEVYVLYLDDYYGNYRLKFYVVMEDGNIIDIYWLYDSDTKLYFVEDGEKTTDFEYYYAMYIVDSLVGEEVIGLAALDTDIEKKVEKEFKTSANAIFTYGKLHYKVLDNSFYLKCDVENMDYYGGIESTRFTVLFTKLEGKKKKNVWYYGDSSFEYVNWDVNI